MRRTSTKAAHMTRAADVRLLTPFNAALKSPALDDRQAICRLADDFMSRARRKAAVRQRLAAWPLSTSPLMKAFLSSLSGAIAPWTS
jgi:hypothetical protein